jgi:hypothetical protein
MAFNGGSGGGVGEGFAKTVGIRITADTKGLQKGVQDARGAFGALVTEADKAAKKAGAFGGAMTTSLDEARKRATQFGDALANGIGLQAPKAFGDLAVATKKQGGLFDELTKKMVSAELIIGGLGKAWQAVGNYMQGAFERAKIDPALAGINQMRQLTEDWTREWQKAVDGVINTIAEGLYGSETNTRGGSARASARDSAIEELRQKGYPVDAPGFQDSQEYKDTYGRYLGGFQRRAFGSAVSQLTAQGLTSAAIARDRGYAGIGPSQFFDSAFGALTDWGQSVPNQTERLAQEAGGFGSGLARFFGGGDPRSRGAARRPVGSLASGVSDVFGAFGGLGNSLRYGVSHLGTGYYDADSLRNQDTAGPGLDFLGGGHGGDLDAMYGVGQGDRSGAGMKFLAGGADGMAKSATALNDMKDALSGVGGSLMSTVGAALAAGDASAKAAFKAGAAQMKTLAITEGIQAIASFWNPPKAAAHAAAAAAAGAASVLLNGLAGSGGGSGGGAAPGGGSGYGGGGGYSSQPASYFVPHGTRDGSGPNAQNVTINIGVAGEGAGQVIATELEKARQSGRHRSESTRVVKYE